MDNSAIHKYGLHFFQNWRKGSFKYTEDADYQRRVRDYMYDRLIKYAGMRKDFAYYEVYGY